MGDQWSCDVINIVGYLFLTSADVSRLKANIVSNQDSSYVSIHMSEDVMEMQMHLWFGNSSALISSGESLSTIFLCLLPPCLWKAVNM